MSLETECEFCRHRKASHLIFRDGMNQFLDCGVTDCQCPKYISDSEGFDIQDVKDYVDATDVKNREQRAPAVPLNIPNGSQVEYDASSDSVSPLQHYMSGAERSIEEMVQATDILLDKEESTHLPINTRELKNGDIWNIPGQDPLYNYNGGWYSLEQYQELTHADIDEKDEGHATVNDPVNHPSHYTAYPGIEVIQLTRWMSFNLGNAVKYISRAGLKDSDKEIQDLEKAIWYIKDEIARKKGEYGEQQK